jgi:hypothetical protein
MTTTDYTTGDIAALDLRPFLELRADADRLIAELHAGNLDVLDEA